MMSDSNQIMKTAYAKGLVIPAFNIPYLPMLEPTIRAIIDANSVGLLEVARLEWTKFEAVNLEAVAAEYRKYARTSHTRLHLDHIPVIDEDGLRVDYREIIARAIQAGFESVMIDGSRLPLQENIEATRQVAEMAHAEGIPVEGELGAVLGHESGLLPPYDELFASGKGFTDPDEAVRFVKESGVDWLSVAIGNLHGAITPAAQQQKKIEARLNIERLSTISRAVGIPLVLHGGTGIQQAYLLESFRHGIAKINIGTATRKPFEALKAASIPKAQDATYQAVIATIDELGVRGSADALLAI